MHHHACTVICIKPGLICSDTRAVHITAINVSSGAPEIWMPAAAGWILLPFSPPFCDTFRDVLHDANRDRSTWVR